MMTAIILVNWNGADDTIACLESLSRMTEPHFVVIADNSSSDDSVPRIQAWIDEFGQDNPVVKGYQLLSLDANYGFAVGNNKALATAMLRNPDYCMLLNNDTEVEPDFLSKLVAFAENNNEVKVLSPCICYHSQRDKVWFSGGQLTFGSRKNLYAEKNIGAVGNTPFTISFISGCALFFHTSLLNEQAELLYNDFFFGEEDYEFSLRMKKEGVKMMCVPQSVVYHKVGSSQKRTNDTRGLGRVYMYYHNRLVCARLYYSSLSFLLIRLLSCPLCFKYFKQYSGSHRIAWQILKRLLKDVKTHTGFSHADFSALMFDNTYFSFNTSKVDVL